jgi:hypothetical protein
MFFASWPDRRSLLIDTDDEKKARFIATDVGESAPASLAVVPTGVLVFEVFDDPDDDEAPIIVEPIDVAGELLETLEDASDANTDAPPPLVLVPAAVCGAEAFEGDSDESVLTCALAPRHAGKHRGGGMSWEDE